MVRAISITSKGVTLAERGFQFGGMHAYQTYGVCMICFAATTLLVLIQVVGAEFMYTVNPGDSLTAIGARFGVEARVIAEGNNLEPSSRLKAGHSLRIDNRHIVPDSQGFDIVINVPQRMLFYFRDGRVLRHYPVAVGKPSWQTPIGAFSVMTMERDPVWDVPPSIQQEMRSQGKPVVTKVPPSPENPLGEYWIGLSLSAVGIHGTNAPATIYKSQTHGCLRLHPQDIEDLFSLVEVGAAGVTIYKPFLLARSDDSVFLEVHPDVYKKSPPSVRTLQEIARAGGLADMVDWALVEEVLRKHDGIARDVTRR